MKSFRGLLLALGIMLGFAVLVSSDDKAAAAACAPATDYGSATITVSIPATGTYKAYTRMMADTDANNNSYFLEIDGNTCLVIGDNAAISNSAWTWVDYKDGNTGTKATHVFSTTGNHTVKLIGREPNVKLDRVIFTQDMNCVPSGTGDNCASPSEPEDTEDPTVSVTSPTGDSTISGNVNLTANASDNVGVTKVEFYVDGVKKGEDASSPYSLSLNSATLSNGTHNITAKAYDAAANNATSATVTVTASNTFRAEDINQDGVVNLLDFSLLAVNFNKSGGAITNARSDINSDGTVNLLDFSLLASKFGT